MTTDVSSSVYSLAALGDPLCDFEVVIFTSFFPLLVLFFDADFSVSPFLTDFDFLIVGSW